jgi:hypothetical protein
MADSSPQGFGYQQYNNGVSGFRGSVSNAFSSTAGISIVSIIMVLAIVAVIIYVTYSYLTTSLTTTSLLSKPINMSEKLTIASTRLPALNGNEYALSFWVNVTKNNFGEHAKPFIYFGTSSGRALLSASMDRNTNKMYFLLKTSGALEDTSVDTVLSNYKAKSASLAHVVVPVEYVPADRWINYVLVQDNNVVTVYQDGDLYNVTPLDVALTANGASNTSILSPVSTVQVGGATGVEGAIAKVKFFNYALSVYHARVIYRSGPGVGGVLSYVGINDLRLQWPLTRKAPCDVTTE